MDTSAIDSVLSQMRAAAAIADQPARTLVAPAAGTDFAAVLKHTLDGINSTQIDATRLARDFELGKPDAKLNDVMLSIQKANISFQEMVQVRNRLVSAYQNIMNMQV